ncbi:MAG: ECF transporter S component [Clostridia bacterium]|nr:ECF transporter S component [Clostridia bacterium]
MNRNIRFITRVAILLAITLVFQYLGRFMGPQNNFIVGPVVNAVLLIATQMTGLSGGLVIAIIAPIASALTNKAAIAPIILAFSPCIIAGNAILVLAYYFLKKRKKLVGVAAGAIGKSVFLYGAILIFIGLMKLNPKVGAALTLLFSWPQLVTAILGGMIALAILPVLERTIKE